LFDPFARGQAAIEVVQAAAEKFGYIVAASNNSKNGPMGGSREAAIAMWEDTQLKLPIDARRRYVAGLSGGSRVAASVALSCGDCVAGVIANGAGFPPDAVPPRNMKFAYFAAVGNADFSYAEFVKLRRELERANARHRIRIFEGSHGWAPSDVWSEALNWMDILAMATGDLPRDESRITQTLNETLARAQALESHNDPLAALREYQWVVRVFSGLADVEAAKAKLAQLEKSKEVKAAEKREVVEIDEQRRIVKISAAQMQKLSIGQLDPGGFSELLSAISELKSKTERAGPNKLVLRRALSELVVQAYDSGQICLQKKDYNAALAYFHLAVAGSSKPAFAHYQRARAYAMSSQKKDMLAELRLALSEGFHEASALDGDDFERYRNDGEFYVTGIFSGTANFGAIQVTSSGYGDLFLAKFGSNGAIQAVKTIGQAAGPDDEGRGVAVDGSGNAYVAGQFGGTITVAGTSLTSAGGTDILLVKYNSSLAPVWAKAVGSAGDDNSFGLVVDGTGAAYLLGKVADDTTFGPAAIYTGRDNYFFLAKVDGNGNFLWASPLAPVPESFFLDNSSGCYGLIIDNSGSVVVTGRGYIGQFTSGGSRIWTRGYPTFSIDYVNDVAEYAGTNIYVVGKYQDPATLDSFTLAPIGAGDIFIAKLQATVAQSPSITVQPVSQSVTEGGKVTFTVSATGSAPLSYQWRHDGVDIFGQTSTNLTISTANTSSAGTYTVVVSNAAGSVTSSGATPHGESHTAIHYFPAHESNGGCGIRRNVRGRRLWFNSLDG
jgi:tetratricopeptide (TPR) repeat protein